MKDSQNYPVAPVGSAAGPCSALDRDASGLLSLLLRPLTESQSFYICRQLQRVHAPTLLDVVSLLWRGGRGWKPESDEDLAVCELLVDLGATNAFLPLRQPNTQPQPTQAENHG